MPEPITAVLQKRGFVLLRKISAIFVIREYQESKC